MQLILTCKEPVTQAMSDGDMLVVMASCQYQRRHGGLRGIVARMAGDAFSFHHSTPQSRTRIADMSIHGMIFYVSLHCLQGEDGSYTAKFRNLQRVIRIPVLHSPSMLYTRYKNQTPSHSVRISTQVLFTLISYSDHSTDLAHVPCKHSRSPLARDHPFPAQKSVLLTNGMALYCFPLLGADSRVMRPPQAQTLFALTPLEVYRRLVGQHESAGVFPTL